MQTWPALCEVGDRFLNIGFTCFFGSRYTYYATGWTVQISNLVKGEKFFVFFSKMTETSKILYQTINLYIISNYKLTLNKQQKNRSEFYGNRNSFILFTEASNTPCIEPHKSSPNTQTFLKFMPLFTPIFLGIFYFISSFNIKIFYAFLISQTCAVSSIAFASPPDMVMSRLYGVSLDVPSPTFSYACSIPFRYFPQHLFLKHAIYFTITYS